MKDNASLIIQKLKEGRNIFLTGGAGVGKSYTIKKILENKELKIIPLASTALAAINIKALTIHKFFKFKIAKNISELKTSKEDLLELNKILKNIDVVLIDEISMVSADLFDMIHHRIQNYNIKLLVVGDFYQLEPVLSDGKYAFLSQFWKEFDFYSVILNKQHRMNDEEFYKNLLKIRLANVDDCCVDYFYNYITDQDLNFNEFDDYTIICGTNKEAKFINQNKLAKIEAKSYKAKIDIIKNKFSPSNKIEQWIKTLPIEEDFEFKIGAKVIFTYNAHGFYNGMQGEIISYNEEQEVICVKSNNLIFSVEKTTFEYYEEYNTSNIEADAIIKAYALKLAYAITIHKSQGMSIEKLLCKCDNIFAKGQLYVAFSRAKNPNTFKISFNSSYNFFALMLKTKAKANKAVDDFYSTLKGYVE